MADVAEPTTRRLPLDEPCRNCGDPTPGRFCPACGQRKVDVRVSVRHILDDVLEDTLIANPALPRTVTALLLHPGKLTNEYVRGRVKSYAAPFRLYLVASVLFFLMISFISLRALDRTAIGDRSVSLNADSARAELLAREAELAAIDTTVLGPAPRALVRQAVANNRAALEMLNDSAVALDGARYEDLLRQVRGEAALPRGSLQPWAQQMRVSSTSPWLQAALDNRLEQVGHLPPQQAVRTVLSDMLEYAPHVMFLLLPLFALLLKLLYIRRDRYYAEHFVFSLHLHTFYFVTFCIMALIPWGTVDNLIILWMIIYTWLAMKRVYGQGWLRTTAKWWVLGWSYMFIILFGLVGLAVATLLFT